MMFNPHPPLSGFPPALLILLLVAEIAGGRGAREIRRFLLLSTLVFSASAYFSGLYASEFASSHFEVPAQLISTHEGYARLFLLLFLPLTFFGIIRDSAYGNRLISTLYRLLLTASLGIVIYTGHLGGELVFEHGAGVTLRAQGEKSPTVPSHPGR